MKLARVCLQGSRVHGQNAGFAISPFYIDGLVQEWRNSSALAMELRLSCINPLIYAVVKMLIYTAYGFVAFGFVDIVFCF